jgi:hypothetical protein
MNQLGRRCAGRQWPRPSPPPHGASAPTLSPEGAQIQTARFSPAEVPGLSCAVVVAALKSAPCGPSCRSAISPPSPQPRPSWGPGGWPGSSAGPLLPSSRPAPTCPAVASGTAPLSFVPCPACALLVADSLNQTGRAWLERLAKATGTGTRSIPAGERDGRYLACGDTLAVAYSLIIRRCQGHPCSHDPGVPELACCALTPRGDGARPSCIVASVRLDRARRSG